MGTATGHKPEEYGDFVQPYITHYVWQSGKRALDDDGLQQSASENRLSPRVIIPAKQY